MEVESKNKFEELDAELAKLERKQLSVYLFSILLALGALGLFVLSIYVYQEFYEPNRNIFDLGNFKIVWGPMFIAISIGIKLVVVAFKNLTVFLSKINKTKEELQV